MRKWVVADVHGCYRTVKELVEKQLRPAGDDTLYFLGDYIDRGPRSKEVIDYLRNLKRDGLKLKTLMGNHEEEMFNAYNESLLPSGFLKFPAKRSRKNWYKYGGDTTMKSFGTDDLKAIPAEYTDWLKNLELYIEEEHFILSHAGFNFREENIFGDTHAMRWIRDFDVDMEKTGGRRVIHGHVPVPLDLIERFIGSDRYSYIDLDNGCVYPGRSGMGNLVALDLVTLEMKVQRNIDM